MPQQYSPLADADALCRIGVTELTRHFAAGKVSPVDVARAVLARADIVNTKWNAFTRIDHDGALAAARASEQRWRRGEPVSPIDGVPTTIKDVVWVRNWPTGYGSRAARGSAAAIDSPAVERLRNAGAVLVGLTTTPELGWKAVTDCPLSGVTRNPWNADLTPGGSSGGAAVAAATGAGVLHLGSDGGGSIRIPAAFSGIVGLKPTFGRVPVFPGSAFGTLVHVGPMTRRVEDALAMLRVMSGRDGRDWLQGAGTLAPLTHDRVELARLRIGYWRTPPCGSIDLEIGAIVDATVLKLQQAGAVVEEVKLPPNELMSTFETLWFSSAASRLARFDPEQRAMMDPGLLEITAIGVTLSAVRYCQAMGERNAFGAHMDDLLERYSILVSPATTVLPFAAGKEVPPGSGLRRWIEWAGFSFPVNLSQQPAIVVPCGLSAARLPIGLQFIGARGADALVMAAAEAFEELQPQGFL
jgi:aspartyl-tRNA(Asn)/glutamyl-tRNA(Gln) amidotransferase subunit A